MSFLSVFTGILRRHSKPVIGSVVCGRTTRDVCRGGVMIRVVGPSTKSKFDSDVDPDSDPNSTIPIPIPIPGKHRLPRRLSTISCACTCAHQPPRNDGQVGRENRHPARPQDHQGSRRGEEARPSRRDPREADRVVRNALDEPARRVGQHVQVPPLGW
jgi:hypothetical protein